jgi:hypothetical protein
VVEVGAGYVLEVAPGLQARCLDVVLTDKEQRVLGGLRVEKNEAAHLPGFNWRLVNVGEARFYLFSARGIARTGRLLIWPPRSST